MREGERKPSPFLYNIDRASLLVSHFSLDRLCLHEFDSQLTWNIGQPFIVALSPRPLQRILFSGWYFLIAMLAKSFASNLQWDDIKMVCGVQFVRGNGQFFGGLCSVIILSWRTWVQNQQSYITNHVLLLTGTKMGFMSDRISKEQVREVLNI